MEEKKKSGVDPLLVIVFIGAAVIAALELLQPKYSKDDDTVNRLLSTLITRAIGVVIFIPMALRSGYKVYGFTKTRPVYACLITIPALLVVVNNLPIIGLISGNAHLTQTGGYLWLYAAESFSIGLFEELAFRGVLFPMVLEKRRDSTRTIFWATVVSSALFGLVHLVNLAVDGNPLSVVLQIGYSFLIGGMCAVVLLRTRCVWVCVILHSVFDFCGYLVPTLGEGIIWDAATVTITAVLGVMTLVHYLFVMKKITPADIEAIYG